MSLSNSGISNFMGDIGGLIDFLLSFSLSLHSNIQHEQQFDFNLKCKKPNTPPMAVPAATIIETIDITSTINYNI
jgi:hypothetical protein